MNVTLERLGIEQPPNEEHFFPEIGQGLEHLAQLHVLAFALRPPFLAMKSITREKHRQSNRGLAGHLATAKLIAPNIERFQPRQGHADADAAQKRAPRKAVRGHKIASESS